jgi:hypothetical protein
MTVDAKADFLADDVAQHPSAAVGCGLCASTIWGSGIRRHRQKSGRRSRRPPRPSASTLSRGSRTTSSIPGPALMATRPSFRRAVTAARRGRSMTTVWPSDRLSAATSGSLTTEATPPMATTRRSTLCRAIPYEVIDERRREAFDARNGSGQRHRPTGVETVRGRNGQASGCRLA